jgi:hypothetical protein
MSGLADIDLRKNIEERFRGKSVLLTVEDANVNSSGTLPPSTFVLGAKRKPN